MKIKVAVLDDYQQVALNFADWAAVQENIDLQIFHDHLFNEDELLARLLPFEVICVMRERTPLQRPLLARLPNLKLIVSTGMRNASIDVQAAAELGITVKNTAYVQSGAPELTWALLMAIARHIPQESNNFRSGGWQSTVGTDLQGKTIGIIGLGRVGAKMAAYAKAFDMKILAWSQNLTAEKAAEAGAELVSKETLLRESDFVTIHLVLSDRSRGIIRQTDLELMKQSAYFINTSRGPLVDEQGLINVLQKKKIAGAAIDVFDTEPLAHEHPFRQLDNVLGTSHIGYVTRHTYEVFYQDTVKAIQEWLENAS